MISIILFFFQRILFSGFKSYTGERIGGGTGNPLPETIAAGVSEMSDKNQPPLRYFFYMIVLPGPIRSSQREEAVPLCLMSRLKYRGKEADQANSAGFDTAGVSASAPGVRRMNHGMK